MTFRQLYNLPSMPSRVIGNARYRDLRNCIRTGDYPYFDPYGPYLSNLPTSATYRAFSIPSLRQISAARREALAQYVRENLDWIRDGVGLDDLTLEIRRLTTRQHDVRSIFSRITGCEAFYCHNCNQLHRDVDGQYLEGFGQTCAECVENEMVFTVDSDIWVNRAAAYYYNDAWHVFDEESGSDGVAGYHDHPDRAHKIVRHASDPDDPHKDLKGPIRIGVEWEVECDSESCRERAASRLDDTSYALGETDGSLDGDTGLEVITGWSTIATVNRWLAEIHQIVDPEGAEGCGIHVNISGLSSDAYHRLTYFFNNYKDFNRSIAGRWDTNYAGMKYLHDLDAAERLNTDPDHDKYLHVNLRSWFYESSRYAEVRLFAGTTSLKVARSRVQYAYLVAQYCASASTTLEDLTPTRFAQWLDNSPNEQALAPDFCTLHKTALRTAGALSVAGTVKAPPSSKVPFAAAGDIETVGADEILLTSTAPTFTGNTATVSAAASWPSSTARLPAYRFVETSGDVSPRLTAAADFATLEQVRIAEFFSGLIVSQS